VFAVSRVTEHEENRADEGQNGLFVGCSLVISARTPHHVSERQCRPSARKNTAYNVSSLSSSQNQQTPLK